MATESQQVNDQSAGTEGVGEFIARHYHKDSADQSAAESVLSPDAPEDDNAIRAQVERVKSLIADNNADYWYRHWGIGDGINELSRLHRRVHKKSMGWKEMADELGISQQRVSNLALTAAAFSDNYRFKGIAIRVYEEARKLNDKRQDTERLPESKLAELIKENPTIAEIRAAMSGETKRVERHTFSVRLSGTPDPVPGRPDAWDYADAVIAFDGKAEAPESCSYSTWASLATRGAAAALAAAIRLARRRAESMTDSENPADEDARRARYEHHLRKHAKVVRRYFKERAEWEIAKKSARKNDDDEMRLLAMILTADTATDKSQSESEQTTDSAERESATPPKRSNDGIRRVDIFEGEEEAPTER